MDLVTLGGGCFWCVEAIFQNVSGISNISCGYAGGLIDNPSYKEVSNGSTGHAEVVQFKYDSDIISYKDILEIFWSSHNPTTLNKQGADIGSQYRSAIFYHNESQKNIAEKIKEEMNKLNIFDSDIVTEITNCTAFYIAEEYHQNYFRKNPNIPYCNYVIKPKLTRFLSNYRKDL